jgi:hypothetical protein
MATLTKPIDPSVVYNSLADAKAAYNIGDVYSKTVRVVTKNSSNQDVTTNYTYKQTVLRYTEDIYGKWHIECTETKTK